MDAVVALTGHGGWPMTVFLTPDGEPFYGGTYYPPEPRHGLPALPPGADGGRRGLPRAARRRRRARRAQLVEHLAERGERARRPPTRSPRRCCASAPEPRAAVRAALGRLRRRAQVPARLDARVPAAHAPPIGDDEALAMATHTLDGMALGGMWDARRRRLPPLLGRRAAGSCRTSRRCSTTTRCSPRAYLAWLGRDRRGALPRGRRAHPRVRAARAARCRRAASPRRRTRTPTASRG